VRQRALIACGAGIVTAFCDNSATRDAPFEIATGPKFAQDLLHRHVRKRPVAGDRLTIIRAMNLDADAAYLVVKARDARFDGRLFVGVTTTGI
jgi:hypothetical protein